MAREILATSPVADLIAGEEFPGPAVATPEQAVRYSLTAGTGIYHAVGAAAMGVSADDVTDPQLRVRGAEGLRVADASVLPVQVSGNTGGARDAGRLSRRRPDPRRPLTRALLRQVATEFS